MKSTQLFALGALISTCTFATAQDKSQPPAGAKREIPAEVLAKFDTDHDGKLSPEERKVMHQEMKAMEEKHHAAMLAKYDKDGDGKLSEAEKATMKADMKAKREALLVKYDANKNGKLDPEEVKAAREAGEELPPMHRPGGKGGKDGKGKGGAADDQADQPPAAPAE